MAYMCVKGFGECDGCGYCTEETEETYEEEYRPEDDWEEEG